jgi:very-short-patch-repair endonuclease
LVLEADGREVHSTPDALYRDRWRANALVALGHDVIRCTWADTLDPDRVPAMVRSAR